MTITISDVPINRLNIGNQFIGLQIEISVSVFLQQIFHIHLKQQRMMISDKIFAISVLILMKRGRVELRMIYDFIA